jgi:hypothetical protein
MGGEISRKAAIPRVGVEALPTIAWISALDLRIIRWLVVVNDGPCDVLSLEPRRL